MQADAAMLLLRGTCQLARGSAAHPLLPVEQTAFDHLITGKSGLLQDELSLLPLSAEQDAQARGGAASALGWHYALQQVK